MTDGLKKKNPILPKLSSMTLSQSFCKTDIAKKEKEKTINPKSIFRRNKLPLRGGKEMHEFQTTAVRE